MNKCAPLLLSTHGYIVYCLCVCFCVCLFVRIRISPPRIKLAGVKFCTVVLRRPGQGISHFGELCSPEAQNQTNRPARGPRALTRALASCPALACGLRGVALCMPWPIRPARWPRVGSACVDRGQSPLTYMLL